MYAVPHGIQVDFYRDDLSKIEGMIVGKERINKFFKK